MNRDADTTDTAVPPAPAAVAPPDAPAANPARWRIFGIVSLALLMSSIDQTIVATALPALQHDLHAPINWASWTITVYALGRTLGFPMLGRLSDQYSRRTVFVASVLVFTVASLGCGLANDIYLMIVLRAIQALGGSAFVPSATGLVADYFGAGRDRAVGMFSSIVPIGGLVGPVLGGVFVAYLSWRWIFLVNVPIGILLVLLALRYIPATRQPLTAKSVDLLGMLFFGLTILGTMTGISFLGEPGAGVLTAQVLLPEGIAVAAGILFVWHIRRVAYPFIRPALLTGRGFGALNVINLFYGAAALGFAALVPLYATQRYHIGSLSSGLLLTARAVGMIGVSAIAAMLLRRTGYRWPIAVGFTVIATGLIGMSLPAVGSPHTWLLVFAAVTGVGIGITQPASNNASIELARDQVAAIVGLRGMFRQSGSIAAIAITTAILARSADPGLTQGVLLATFAGLLVLTIPLIAFVPNHRGQW